MRTAPSDKVLDALAEILRSRLPTNELAQIVFELQGVPGDLTFRVAVGRLVARLEAPKDT
jgi:hypothetical protein